MVGLGASGGRVRQPGRGSSQAWPQTLQLPSVVLARMHAGARPAAENQKRLLDRSCRAGLLAAVVVVDSWMCGARGSLFGVLLK